MLWILLLTSSIVNIVSSTPFQSEDSLTQVTCEFGKKKFFILDKKICKNCTKSFHFQDKMFIEGKNRYNELKKNSIIPKYGECWTNALHQVCQIFDLLNIP